ncbi:unnamed protein product [[Actinomadura] parvosata subsp. kistnae]|nr:unnamed protein product [Actinomadura parvosata subsp. kistnae]
MGLGLPAEHPHRGGRRRRRRRPHARDAQREQEDRPGRRGAVDHRPHRRRLRDHRTGVEHPRHRAGRGRPRGVRDLGAPPGRADAAALPVRQPQLQRRVVLDPAHVVRRRLGDADPHPVPAVRAGVR